MNRRSLLKAAGSMAGVAAVAGAATASEKPKLQFNNADFYSGGKFDAEKGKDAVLALCKHHGYPVFPGMRDNLWVSDYGAGEFTKMGLAAYIFANNVEDHYMMLDIFLLPNQMLAEHWHVEAEGNVAKREGWLVRWGLSHIVGVGEPNLGKDIVIPKCHWGGKVTTEHETIATPGMFVPLAKVYTRHWQYGGPEGAIITEVANVHTGSGVRHTDPAVNENFLASLKAAK